MKKGATNGNKKKWWIRFLDEKVPTMETKEIVWIRCWMERKNEKHHSGWMSSAALCSGPNFADQCAVVGGVLETGPSPSGYLSGFHDWCPWLSEGSSTRFWYISAVIKDNQIPHFLVCDSWFSILFEERQFTSQNNSGYVPVLRWNLAALWCLWNSRTRQFFDCDFLK